MDKLMLEIISLIVIGAAIVCLALLSALILIIPVVLLASFLVGYFISVFLVELVRGEHLKIALISYAVLLAAAAAVLVLVEPVSSYSLGIFLDWWAYGGIGWKGILLKVAGIFGAGLLVMIPLQIVWMLWMGGRDERILSKAKRREGPGDYLLGFSVDKRKPQYLDDDLRSEHLLVLGSTGTGKTTSALEPAIKSDIERGRGLIFITAKDDQDFLKRAFSYATEAGRGGDVQIFTLSDTPKSDSYNPLSSRDETALRDLCMEAFDWDNAYYRDQAKSALLYVFSAMVESGKAFTLMDLYYAFTEKGCLDLLCEMATDSRIKHHLKSYSDDWKTFRDNMRGLAANLEDYTTRKLAGILCTADPDIDLVDIYKQNKIAIFVLNSLQYGETARRLGKMLIQDIRLLSGSVMEEGRAPFFPVYIDEFHHFVYPEFFSMVAQCRSANIGIMLSTQSFADMKGIGWDITTQVVQNTNTKLILRQNDADSAEYAARLAGTRTTEFVTDQLEDRVIFGQKRTGLSSVRAQEEFVIHPNMLRSLEKGQAALIHHGRAQVVALNRAMPPEKCSDPNDRRTVRGESNSIPPLDLYGQWRGREESRKGSGIRRPAKRESSSKAKGIDAIRAKMEKKES